MSENLDGLIEQARSVVMTPEQAERQRVSFATGNVEIDRHDEQKVVFDVVPKPLGVKEWMELYRVKGHNLTRQSLHELIALLIDDRARMLKLTRRERETIDTIQTLLLKGISPTAKNIAGAMNVGVSITRARLKHLVNIGVTGYGPKKTPIGKPTYVWRVIE